MGLASLKCVCNIIYILFSSQVQSLQNYIYIYILHIYNLSKAKEGEGENPGSKPSSCTGEGIDTAHQAGVSMQRQGVEGKGVRVDAARRPGASTQRGGVDTARRLGALTRRTGRGC